MAKRRVVLTGAAGYISAQLLPAFREHYDLVLLDLTKETKEGRIDEIQEVDLTDPDVDKYREHFRGAGVIVHNADRAVLENMEIPGGQVAIGVPPKILSEVSHEQRSAWDWGLKLCQALPACWHKTLRGP